SVNKLYNISLLTNDDWCNSLSQDFQAHNSGYPMPASTGFNSKDFDIAFEGVCSLRDIEMAIKPLSDKEIKDNMGDLKKKLAGSTTSHAEEILVPGIIQEKCDFFVENFSIDNLNELPPKLSHNKTWKESEEDLVEISGEILNTLGDVWRNPAFGPKFENTQSEGTYVTDVIVPLLRATLKKLPVRKIALLST
ncbi:8035_t:CDS:2, partial [Funneliformis geosporum]